MMVSVIKKISGATGLVYDLALLPLKLFMSVVTSGFRHFVPPRKKNLQGETVLVTGAGHGIGRELAVQLAALGCTIVCWDIDSNANHSTKIAIHQQNGRAYDFTVDVTKRSKVHEMRRFMRSNGIPEISILINNAATLISEPFLEHAYNDVEKTFNLNVFSNIWTIEAFLPDMLRSGRGHVICMCSLCGMYGVAEKVVYCSSKFAVRGLMDGLREEFRSYPSLKFTTVYPFYVATGLARDPKYRFPWIFGKISPEFAAQEVINALQRNYSECIIPRSLFTLNYFLRIMPESSVRIVLDFLSNKKTH